MVDVLCTDAIVGFGDVGGVIDTTISSLSISSSFSLLTDALSVGEHCDFRTASNMYRFVNSSADLLPVCANMKYIESRTKEMEKKKNNEFIINLCEFAFVLVLGKLKLKRIGFGSHTQKG